MKQKIKKIWNIINYVLIALALILAIALVGVRLVGLDIYTVLSESMEPEYMKGSVIYVKEADPETLKIGDDITFRLDGEVIATHRIIFVTKKDSQTAFRTKGIANFVEDQKLVLADQVLGTPVFTIPHLGNLAKYISSPEGRGVAIGIGIALMLSICLPDILFGKTKKPTDKNKNETPSE